MKKLDFIFVDNVVLRKNIEGVYTDTIELGIILGYQKRAEVESVLRKTIIIYTASIIEALLLWKLKKEIGGGKVELKNEYTYKKVVSIPVRTEKDTELLVVEKVCEKREIDKMDFVRRIDVCEKYAIIKGKELLKKLHTVRNIRNEIHIGGLAVAEKKYSLKEVRFVFDTLEQVIKSIK